VLTEQNVIVGRPIPAGTGMMRYHDFHIEEPEVPEVMEDDGEGVFLEFGEEDIRALPQGALESD
jgi:hypothetical protein